VKTYGISRIDKSVSDAFPIQSGLKKKKTLYRQGGPLKSGSTGLNGIYHLVFYADYVDKVGNKLNTTENHRKSI
jgi:hypothetical protein